MLKDKTGKDMTSSQVFEKGIIRAGSIGMEFTVYLLHIIGYFPMHTVRRLFYRAAGLTIGKGSAIHMGARFYNPTNIEIGDDTIIGEDVVLDGRDKLNIGSHVDIASDVMIYNCQHNIHSNEFEAVSQPVIIKDYVFIGPRAIILPGVTLGKGSAVAAGAVVTKDVDEYTVVAGIPAKPVGLREDKDLGYMLGRAAWFR